MSLEILRRRIESTEGLHSVVGTMKTLSLSRIRQCEEAAAAIAAYESTIVDGLRIALWNRPFETRLATEVRGDRAGALVLGSAQGMCGRYNERLAEFARERLSERTRVAAAGERVAEALTARGATPGSVIDAPESVEAIDDAVREALAAIEGWRGRDGVDRIELVFHRRRTVATCDPVVVRLLPFDRDWFEAARAEPWPTRAVPAFTMRPERLFRSLLRRHLFATLFGAFAEAVASEHASRLIAMQAAQDNVEERLEELLGEYHHRRQESITAEVLDVTSGFEAMTGEG